MAEIGGGASTGLTGWIKTVDVQPQAGEDVVDSKTYQDAAETILQSCRSSSLAIDVTVRSAFPRVTIDTTTVELPQAADGGHYEGDVSVTLTAPGTIQVASTTPDGGSGARDNFTLTYVAPPALTDLSFTGGYPGAQSELKAGDTYNIAGTADKNIDAVQVLDQDAGTSELLAVPTNTSFVAAVTIADRGDTVQALPVVIRVRDAVTGAFSAVRATNELGGAIDGVDLVFCNDLYPTIGVGSISYPGGQQAIKDAESATVPNTISNADSAVYDDPTGELTITNPTTIENPKTVTRFGGTYNISTPNLRIVATRNANDAVTTRYDTVVAIAHTQATIQVSSATRLRSGGNDGTAVQSHVITLTSNQQLLSAPTLDADSGGNRGTFVGSWSGGPLIYTRSLQVDETAPDEKGTFTFEGLVATGLAGRVQNTIGSGANYVLGGFVARTKTIPALATTVTINVEVTDIAKFSVALITSTAQPGVIQPIGTSPPVTNGITVNSLGVNPTTVIWLDTVAASQNTGGTAQFQGIEEAI